MNLEQRITEKVESLLSSPLHFVVEISLSTSRMMPKLQVLLDGDEGIGIDDCVKVSRALGAWIEEEELIDSAYTLEVSSPGIDWHLNSVRQYKKNEGRKLKIVDAEGKTRKGKLIHANETGIEWEEEVKQQGKKKVELITSQLTYDQIKKCNVMVSFD